MVTDKQRHDVAQRLREFSRNTWPLTVSGNSATIRYAISDIIFDDKKYHSGVDLLNRLADLIEPPARCPHYMFPCCRTDAGGDYIDRNALVTIADEMFDGTTSFNITDVPENIPAWVVYEWQERIRKAIGKEP